MQLRNGKTVVTELDTSLTSNEKSINYLIGKIINICNDLQIDIDISSEF